MVSLKNMKAFSLFLLLILSLSCASRETLPAKTAETGSVTRPGENTGPVVQETWEQKWAGTLAEAKKERSVVIYAVLSVAPPLKDVLNLFKERYGIVLEVISFGRGAEQSGRLFSERNKGLYLADLFMSGMNTQVETKQRKAFDSLEPAFILPEVMDSKLWYKGQLPWGDKDHQIFNYLLYPVSPIAINTQLVKLEDIRSYYDLLAPSWKGKMILNDPTIAGTAFNSFSSSILNKALDLDYFRQLARQEPVVLRDQTLQIDWLAKGKYPVAIWARDPTVVEYQKAGAPISFIPTIKEGFYLATGGSGLSMINRAPHPNATRVFINWLFSKEGQKHMQNYVKVHSAREDIPTEGVPSVRVPGEKYLLSANSSENWILNEQEAYFDMAKQVFAPLVR